MPALVAGIHVLLVDAAKTWMAGAKPGHDGGRVTATVRWSNREWMGVQRGALRAQHDWAINRLFAL